MTAIVQFASLKAVSDFLIAQQVFSLGSCDLLQSAAFEFQDPSLIKFLILYIFEE